MSDKTPPQKHKIDASVNLVFEAVFIACALYFGLNNIANAIKQHTEMEAVRDGVHHDSADGWWVPIPTKPR